MVPDHFALCHNEAVGKVVTCNLNIEFVSFGVELKCVRVGFYSRHICKLLKHEVKIRGLSVFLR